MIFFKNGGDNIKYLYAFNTKGMEEGQSLYSFVIKSAQGKGKYRTTSTQPLTSIKFSNLNTIACWNIIEEEYTQSTHVGDTDILISNVKIISTLTNNVQLFFFFFK